MNETIKKSQEKSIKNHIGKRDTHFKVGKKVVIRDYLNPNKQGWVHAVIKKKLGKRHYGCIISHNSRIIKRHLNQIRETFSTNDSDRETDSNESDATQNTLASETQSTSNETHASVSSSNLLDVDATVDTFVNTTLVNVSDSSEESFRDVISSKPGRRVRASARIAIDKMSDARRLHLI